MPSDCASLRNNVRKHIEAEMGLRFLRERYRFGLIHVDYSTQMRRIKASGHWYRELIQTRGTRL